MFKGGLEKGKQLKKNIEEFNNNDDFYNLYKINIDFKVTDNKYHDRYIILDYNENNELIYKCSSSSKDSDNRITSITMVNDKKLYRPLINDLLNNKKLVLT